MGSVDLDWRRTSAVQASADHAGVVFRIDQVDFRWTNTAAVDQTVFELSAAPFFDQPRRYLAADPSLSDVMAAASCWAAVFQAHGVML